jgi:hypothetical protein
MKRLIAVLALLPLLALAQTKTSIQLLNPAGSTAGQAVVSTGPTTAPAWTTVTAGGLTPIGANTVYGNFTGSSASPIANAVPSCSTANSALKYTSGTGLSCGTTFALTSGNLSQFAATTSAQLAGVISNETGSSLLVFNTTPTLNQPNIVGTTTNDNAAAGSVGEFPNNQALGVALTTLTSANIASLVNLPAGDYDIGGNFQCNTAGGGVVNSVQASVTSTSATLQTSPANAILFTTAPANNPVSIIPPVLRFSLAAPTTIYLVGRCGFTGGTATGDGFIRARRIR